MKTRKKSTAEAQRWAELMGLCGLSGPILGGNADVPKDEKEDNEEPAASGAAIPPAQ